jgi:hypothetical protein
MAGIFDIRSCVVDLHKSVHRMDSVLVMTCVMTLCYLTLYPIASSLLRRRFTF